MKAAAYCATRNLYEALVPAVKSLLKNSDVDVVYLIIEDDQFPYEMPDCVKTINVSNQKYFWPSGPNFKKKWTYMVLMRMALSKLLPDVDMILSLDVDTIVDKDVSELWRLPMEDNYIAACIEPKKSKKEFYANMGVAMLNLKQLRDGKDDEIIYALNTKEYVFCEQDCVNQLCKGKIIFIDSAYNVCDFTMPTDDPKIIHFAFQKRWMEEKLVQKYLNMPWEKVMNIKPMQYMIHACPQRMWYVEGYLVPSMIEQGIKPEEIMVWNDFEGKGNLFSCMDAFRDCGKREGGTWHLQDDVIISSDFAKVTRRLDSGVVCGFCCDQFENTTFHKGEVYTKHMWYSFQCMRIPNWLAAECADWFYDDASKRKVWQYKVESKKYDDSFFRDFMLEKHPSAKVLNLVPALVDHIDHLLGGSIVNSTRRGSRRAYYFKDKYLVDELEEKLKNQNGGN